jgi:hypothetical protein
VKGSNETIEKKFVWQKQKLDVESLFEISKTQDFSKIELSKKIETENFITLNWEKLGQWYWRVKTFDEKGYPRRASSIQNFKFSEVEPAVTLLEPRQGKVLKNFKNIKLRFTWEASPDAKSYLFELKRVNTKRSPSAKSEKPVLMKKKVDTNEISISDIPFGKFEWSVRAIDEQGIEGAIGDKRSFLHQKKVLPPPTEIFMPEIR